MHKLEQAVKRDVPAGTVILTEVVTEVAKVALYPEHGRFERLRVPKNSTSQRAFRLVMTSDIAFVVSRQRLE